MKKLYLLLFTLLNGAFFCQNKHTSPKKIFNTSEFTLKDSHPNSYQKITPGCIKIDDFVSVKTFLKLKCNIDLDSVGTINIYYIMPKKRCDLDLYKNVKIDQLDNFYFKLHHPSKYTKVNFPVIFVQYESELINPNWKQDDNSVLFNLFLDYDTRLHCDAMITISKNGLYLLAWDYFNPPTFNAFSNELKKFKCD